MKIAVCSDEPHAIHDLLRDDLERRGHQVLAFGSVATGVEAPWAEVAEVPTAEAGLHRVPVENAAGWTLHCTVRPLVKGKSNSILAN